ncbi:MAG: hypothetical protein ABJG47_18085 [Ekhidna sp.]
MKKILIRLGITISIPMLSLIAFILFPGLSYAKKVQVENISIHYNTSLDVEATSLLHESLKMIKKSELFDPDFKIDLCLDDESNYAFLFDKLRGPAFGYGVGNKVILKCEADFKTNKAIGYGQAWDLAELIAHEIIHTYQYHHYGFATLKTPSWKLEGYAEYISRSESSYSELNTSIDLLLSEREKVGESHWVWIKLDDGTGFPSQYLADKVLVQYLIEIEELNYNQISNDRRSRASIEDSALNWYHEKQL